MVYESWQLCLYTMITNFSLLLLMFMSFQVANLPQNDVDVKSHLNLKELGICERDKICHVRLSYPADLGWLLMSSLFEYSCIYSN